MDRISSFSIEHTTLEKGVYVSREDKVGEMVVTTFDVRMKAPYRDKPLNPATAHTLEHCLATFLRNSRDDILYAGPMGCMTGFYVIVKGKKTVIDITESLLDAFEWVMATDVVPGASMKECGNYTFMDLDDAKTEASSFLQVLIRKDK